MKRDIFWNVAKDTDIDKTTFIEHTFKYGDFDDIVEVIISYEIKSLLFLYNLLYEDR